MKKVSKAVLYFLILIMIMLGLCYLGLAYYYGNKFMTGTYINGIYCTGQSPEEVNRELKDSCEVQDLTVVAKTGRVKIAADDISLEADYEEPLKEFLNQQQPFFWISSLIHNRVYQILPSFRFDEEKLSEIFHNQILNSGKQRENKVYLTATSHGFYLHDLEVDVLDENSAYELIRDALATGKSELNLIKEGCYRRRDYTEREKELIAFYKELIQFQNQDVKFRFGNETVAMTRGELASLLNCYPYFKTRQFSLPAGYRDDFYEPAERPADIGRKLAVDSEKAEGVLHKLFQPYNTYQNHIFTTHDGRILRILGGTYGNLIEEKEEKEKFLSFLHSDQPRYDRRPEYRIKALYQGKDDIGSTYIEVDMGKQKLYYFEKGKLILETDVVTGKNSRTDECVCYLYGKQKNRTLRGENYASFVKYWMPVLGAIGIHDSSWRSEYGGEIYKRSGSHGCINTPLKAMEKLYDRVEIGTPVIMYYGLENS